MDNSGTGPNVVDFRTTTTTTITRNGTSSGSFINYRYFKSVPGILKFFELLVGIICITTATPVVLNETYFLLIVAYLAIIITTLWIIVIFFRIESKVAVRPSWPALELFFTIGACLLYSFAMVVQFSAFSNVYFIHYNPKPRSIAAAVFGLINSILYGAGSYFAFMTWRAFNNTLVQSNARSPTF